ncbi:hypothetical protein BTHI11S_02296 [Bosea thiooxidans]
MSTIRLFCDLDGRIGLRSFWIGGAAVALTLFALQKIVPHLTTPQMARTIVAFASAFALFPWAALAAKRATDRGSSPLLARLIAGLPNSAGLFTAPTLVMAVVGALCLAILAVPTLLIALRPALAQAPRFTSFVIAWNWAGIVSASLMAVPAAVFAVGWSTPTLALVQSAFFAAIVLRLRYCVARAAFGPEGPAIALPLIIASVVLDYGVIRLFGLF